jgi:hypothetical protein
MRYYTYNTLNRQCRPQTVAITSNYKFLSEDVQNLNVYPQYPPAIQSTPSLTPNPPKPRQCSANPNGGQMTAEELKAIWGAALWKYMHFAAANYPERPSETQIHEMKSWLECLATTIPCDNCAKHFRAYMDKYKSQMYNICSSKDTLFKFLVDIHNKVNERLGKPIVSYEDAYKLYDNKKCDSCTIEQPSS